MYREKSEHQMQMEGKSEAQYDPLSNLDNVDMKSQISSKYLAPISKDNHSYVPAPCDIKRLEDKYSFLLDVLDHSSECDEHSPSTPCKDVEQINR